MAKPCEYDEVSLETFAIVTAERDALRQALRDATKALRDIIELHNPKEASTYAHQQTVYRAQALAADLERLVTPKNGANHG
jgi:uncharacterized membrane protein